MYAKTLAFIEFVLNLIVNLLKSALKMVVLTILVVLLGIAGFTALLIQLIQH